MLADDADGNPVRGLVRAALDGDLAAWNGLVSRYTLLVQSVVRRHGLTDDDAEDVVQTVWLRLVENLRHVREPQALPGWIVTTARHECLRVIRGRRLLSPADLTNHAQHLPEGDDAVDAALLDSERHEALLAALAELPDRQRALMLLLVEDPPPSYDEISRRLGMPIGSIGPTRARALDRIRTHPAVQGLRSV